MADWQPLEFKLPAKDLLEPTREALEILLLYLEVLKAILDTVKVLLVDFGNPVKALVEALIRLIEELFLSLKTAGVFAYFDIPDPTTDPNFNRFHGGFEAFVERFKASLYDSKDFNRPQPRAGSSSGFVLLVVDASSPFALIARIKQLLRFFGREFTCPRYEAPGNLRAIPVGTSGDPILAVAKIFTDGPIEAIELQWSLPTNIETPDPGFTDVVTKVAREFVPPKWLVERSTSNPASQSKLDITDLGAPNKVGLVEFKRQLFIAVESEAFNTPVTRVEPLRDEYGDQVIKFETYQILDVFSFPSLLGQLGRFRWIDSNVKENTTYYYRVRALSGDLKVIGDQMAFPLSVGQLTFSFETDGPIMAWPSSSGDSVVMGKPSGIISATVPRHIDPATFDVVGNLQNLFLSAFTLDFHLELSELATFDTNGNPTGDTTAEEVGRGSLVDQASSLAYRSESVNQALRATPTVNEAFQPSGITNLYPELPWQNSSLRRLAKRLANVCASALLESGFDALTGFRSIMQGSLPRGPVTTYPFDTNLESITKQFTAVSELEVTVGNTVTPEGTVTLNSAENFTKGYVDTTLRHNVIAAVEYVKVFTLGGSPVDWISVVPLRDIVPWSGQLIYDLLAKVQALLDAFKGVFDEINAFIALLERKIQALERFLEFLINILNLIESLQIGAYMLFVVDVSDTTSWVNAIDSAGGTPPPKNPGGYSAGISFAYSGTDVVAFKTAFSLIFGA
jgi:hypothetical protein